MIASRLREIREVLGLSMPAFGRKLGCSRDVIANIEYGRVEPKEVFLNHICDVFGVRRAWLYTGEGPMLDDQAGDEKVREAAELFRSLSADLRELALSHMKSLQKLEMKKEAAPVGGAKSNLDTVRLMAAMLEAQDFGQWKDKAGETLKTGEYISGLMEERGVSAQQLASVSGLPERELGRLLSSEGGLRRNALIAISLALSLDIDETQRLLTAAGMPALYAKNRRDAACIFALMKGLSVQELGEMLIDLEEASL